MVCPEQSFRIILVTMHIFWMFFFCTYKIDGDTKVIDVIWYRDEQKLKLQMQKIIFIFFEYFNQKHWFLKLLCNAYQTLESFIVIWIVFIISIVFQNRYTTMRLKRILCSYRERDFFGNNPISFDTIVKVLWGIIWLKNRYKSAAQIKNNFMYINKL